MTILYENYIMSYSRHLNYLFTLVIIMSSFSVEAQQKWASFATDDLTHHFVIKNDTAWVGYRGGICSIDIETGQTQTYNSLNSDLSDPYVQSMNIDPEGNIWLSTTSELKK